MKTVNVMSIDLAKNFIQILGVSSKGKPVISRRISRQKLYEFVTRVKPKTVCMEACSMAHYWGRRFEALGIEVKLLPPQVVRPLRMGEKNDANDAMAIYEASLRPKVHFVPVKTEGHQLVQLWVRRRESLVCSRTQLVNAVRSYLSEFGIVLPEGINRFGKGIEELRGSGALDTRIFQLLEHDLDLLSNLNQQIRFLDRTIALFSKQDGLCQELQKVGGVGPITAVTLRAAIVQPRAFKNGRQFAAYLGLVPKQNSTGGRTRLLGIGKRGNSYLRQLLIHGGRSFIWSATSKEDSKSQWAKRMVEERGFNKASVAVANKNARHLWAVMAYYPEFRQVA